MLGQRGRTGRHPTQTVVVAFVSAIATGTALLMLPFAYSGGSHPGLVRSLFTATSAVTVTGLVSVDMAGWTTFGELVQLVLVQVGGFGIMTIGATLALFTARRLGLRQRMLAQAEIGAVSLGELRSVVATIALYTVAIEGTIAAILAVRLWTGDYEPFGRALYSGVFHAVTSFNNAGVSLYSDNLARFTTDWVVSLAVSVSIILGGIGFPVLLELRRRHRIRAWSLHTKIVLFATGALLVAGPLAVIAFEWTNPDTLGPLSTPAKLLAGWFQGVTPRTAGFNTLDIGALNPATQLVMAGLMFVGAAPASTAGGIKVTTFAVLGFAVWSEARGDPDVAVFRRRVPASSVAQAIGVVVLSIGTIFAATLGLIVLSDGEALGAFFEATSAFGTVGLSVGITPGLTEPAQVLLVLVMLAGRVGPTTFAAALVARNRTLFYRYPEERPIIG